MEKRKQEKKLGNEDDDYGDYVTRCICDFKHDDGYMICCDGCSVWQHVECMQVDPKNLPEKYLCEICEPRPVDRLRARQAQVRKQDDLSEMEDNDSGGRRGAPRSSSLKDGRKGLVSSVHAALTKKRKKKGKVPEPKVDSSKKVKKDRLEQSGSSSGSGSVKKPKKKTSGKSQHGSQRVGSIQSLLTAASLLDGEGMEIGSSSSEGKEYHSLWNATVSPWTDKYETASHNRYSEPVKAFVSGRLSQLKSEAVVYSHREYTTTETRTHPQAALEEVGHKRKGVIAKASIPEDELVLEYKGKVTVKQAVLSDFGSGGKSLWKHKPCPFVYLYDKISDLDLCIDARTYGNLARFMRRSCSPNSELRHFFVSNELHFGVYALNNISTGEEITIPFDFRFEKCDYFVECVCGQGRSSCMVERSNQAILSRKQGRVQHEEKHHSGRTFRQRSHSHVVVDEDSNSSWASTGSGLTRSRRVLQSPTKQASRQASRDVSSDSEEEGAESEKRRKSLSREERKTEQVWKLVEKMEASARRRQNLLSEGSGESDPLSSPSALHSLRHVKERRSSSNSAKKVQLMSGGKMRLSSVSSADPLSPCDFSEAFSPPITPGLAPPSDAAGVSVHPCSPLLSPDPLIPSFEVTPYLHPKYLFADFALPRKKAILKQWESEQHQNGHASKHPYWSNGHSLSICHMTREQTRHRVKGCLKHRWLKKHFEQQKEAESTTSNGIINGSSDKENNTEESKTHPLPYKKQVLLRWQNASESTKELPISESTKELPTSESTNELPTSESTKELPTSESNIHMMEIEKSRKLNVGEVESGRSSPLFEDFSDNEDFEEEQKKSLSSVPEVGETTIKEQVESADDMEPVHREGPKTPPSPSDNEAPSTQDVPAEKPMDLVDSNEDHDLSSISDVSLVSNEKPTEKDGPKTPPPEPHPFKESEVHISDISSDMDTSGSYDDEPTIISLGQTEPVLSRDTIAFVTGDLKSVDVGSLRKELAVDSVPVKYESMITAGGSGVASSELHYQSGVGEESAFCGTDQDIASKKMEDVVTPKPIHTPGKRKINLSEYRNRARKPVDRKEKSSPPHAVTTTITSTTPSFLSHTVTHPLLSTTSYSSSLNLGTVGAMQSAAPAPSGPQFEPVSPDDNDQLTTLTNLEDSGAGIVQGDVTSQHQQPAAVPSFMNRAVVTSMSVYQQQPSALLEQQQQSVSLRGGPPPFLHQQPQGVPVQVVPPGSGQYMMDARWNTMAVDQDVRRVGLGTGEMYVVQPSGLPHTATDHPSSGILPLPAHGIVTVQQAQPAPGQYVHHSGTILQSPLMQQDMGQMMMQPHGRGEYHQPAPHGYAPALPPPPQQQHRPPAGGPVYRPRHSGPGGGTYY